MSESLWIYIQANVLAFLLVILFITLSNIRLIGKLGKYPKSNDYPSVSILVPARNEEANISQCINSLLAQDYPNYEVIVLDDNSTDKTYQILSDLASKDKRLRVIHGEPLPSGWFGKHWACHQLSKTAKGNLMLFTDADTIHHPRSLRDGVSAMIALEADLLTAFPYEELRTCGEQLTVPIFPWFIIAFLPLIIAYRTQKPALSAAIGQFMLFRREAYTKISGHEAIKQHPVDDVALARNIKACGLRWRMVNGVDRIKCRMYCGFREAYKGFTKNLFAGFNYKIIKFLLVWLCLGIVFTQPIVMLIIMPSINGILPILAILCIIASMAIWGASHWFFRFPSYLVFFYPINIFIALMIAFSSMIFALTGKAEWKGRQFVRHKIEWW